MRVDRTRNARARLDAGADADQVSAGWQDGKKVEGRPRCSACYHGHANCAQFLLTHRISRETMDKALEAAIEHKQPARAKLVRRAIAPTADDGVAAAPPAAPAAAADATDSGELADAPAELLKAIAADDAERLGALLKRGAPVAQPTRSPAMP